MVHHISYQINITLQPLSAAFRNLADIFRSYIRAELKKDQRKRARTRTCSYGSPHFLPN
jgi:hypothetical protein